MNRKIAALLCLLPALALAMSADLMPRDQNGQPTGGLQPARAGSEQQLITGDLSAAYFEGARTGKLYSVSTQGASDSFSTAGTSPLGAAGVAWLAVYNPASSAVNFEILTILINTLSGTPGAGGLQYNLACGQAITAAQNATPVSSKDLSAGRGFGYSQLALTGLTAGAAKVIGQSSHAPFAAAVVVNSTGINTYEEVKGRYIVPPGCVFIVAPVAVGTTWLGNGSLSYREAAL